MQQWSHFPPLQSDANTSWDSSTVCLYLSHLLFTFAVFFECDVLNTRVLEYVFLIFGTNLGLTQTRLLVSDSASLVLLRTV